MTSRWLISMGLALLWATPAAAKDVALTFDSSPAWPGTATTAPRTSAVSLSFVPRPAEVSSTKAPITTVVLHTLEALFHGTVTL